jgi:bacteriorhodopsin
LRLFGDSWHKPVAWLLLLNVVLPWVGSYIFATSSLHSSQRQVLYWLAVIFLFTCNQIAARRWSRFRWAFWTISALNLFAILMGGLAFSTVAHQIPTLLRGLLFMWNN